LSNRNKDKTEGASKRKTHLQIVESEPKRGSKEEKE